MGTENLAAEFLSSGMTLITAAIAVGGGIWAYYLQKEFELVQRRYLEEGLDVLIATAENSLNIYSHNWARSLEILKTFRDLEKIDIGEFDKGFLNLPESRFSLTANYRVNTIVDSPIVWYTFQLVQSFCQRGCAITRDEIPVALKTKLQTERIESTREEIVEEAVAVLTELDKESHRYHTFGGQMHRIASLLERQKFRFKTVQALKNHETVRDVLTRLEETFADKLAEHSDNAT